MAPTAFDDIFVPLAIRLIDAAAHPVTFRIVEKGQYRAARGDTIETQNAEYVVNATPPDPETFKFQSDDRVVDGTLTLFIAGGNVPFEPKPGIKATTIDGKKWTVTKASPIYSGELVALWKLEMER